MFGGSSANPPLHSHNLDGEGAVSLSGADNGTSWRVVHPGWGAWGLMLVSTPCSVEPVVKKERRCPGS